MNPAAAPFAIVSNGGRDFTTNSTFATLVGTAPLSVRGMRVNGVEFVFPKGTVVDKNSFSVVAKNRDDFARAYGGAIALAGGSWIDPPTVQGTETAASTLCPLDEQPKRFYRVLRLLQ